MRIYITVKKTRGVAYLYAIKSYYINLPDGSKKRAQIVLKSYGRLDKLQAKEPDIVERLKAEYASAALEPVKSHSKKTKCKLDAKH